MRKVTCWLICAVMLLGLVGCTSEAQVTGPDGKTRKWVNGEEVTDSKGETPEAEGHEDTDEGDTIVLPSEPEGADELVDELPEDPVSEAPTESEDDTEEFPQESSEGNDFVFDEESIKLLGNMYQIFQEVGVECIGTAADYGRDDYPGFRYAVNKSDIEFTLIDKGGEYAIVDLENRLDSSYPMVIF